jgi:hypothetical protein
MRVSGAFDLKSAKDLLAKAKHDLTRLQHAPTDSYVAFDLFVTLRHIPEWIFAGDAKKAGSLFDSHVELRVCRHIADGAKHFSVTGKQHHQIQSTKKTSSEWGKAWGKSWGNSWGTEELVIKLDSSDSDTKSLGNSISAVQLGERTVVILEGLVT